MSLRLKSRAGSRAGPEQSDLVYRVVTMTGEISPRADVARHDHTLRRRSLRVRGAGGHDRRRCRLEEYDSTMPRGPFRLVQPWGHDKARQATLQSEHVTVGEAFEQMDRPAEQMARTGVPFDAVE